MGELGMNKILGALLATALILFGLHQLSAIAFGHGGGHHGHHEEEKSLNEIFAERYAYFIPVEEQAASDDAEPVFDLGLLLASADVSRGERAFKGKCATCHSIDQGGANGTGPNLHAIVGAAKASKAGFGYSNALSGVGGDWSYDALNAWLENPSSYARGTSMAFAGLRRDDERAATIAYLASFTPNAPDFPAPLPAGGGDETDEASLEVTPASADAPAAERDFSDLIETAEDAVEDVSATADTLLVGDPDVYAFRRPDDAPAQSEEDTAADDDGE